jgi:hypothetical protein
MRTLSRQRVIVELRGFLLHIVEDGHSVCEAVARRRIFCQGLCRLSDEELRKRFDWICRTRPGLTRSRLLDLANRYQIGRQEALHAETTCDAAMIDRDTCLGWAEFTNEDLSRFYVEAFRERIRVVNDPPNGRSGSRTDVMVA